MFIVLTNTLEVTLILLFFLLTFHVVPLLSQVIEFGNKEVMSNHCPHLQMSASLRHLLEINRQESGHIS